MRLKLIACEVMYREFCAAASRSLNQVDVEFLPKGLHDRGSARMLAEIQAALDRADAAGYESVAFGYALCGNGLAGLVARSVPVVLPRAHDCITLFLGSKERYLDYFNSHPGVYFKTSGWIERGTSSGLDGQIGYGFEELVAKYGEEDAKYLYEELTKHYRQFTFIEMGIEPGGFEKRAREDAAQRGWGFEKLKGDMSLIQRLVDGPWDEKDFLVVPPGSRVIVTHDDGIVGHAP
jgi:uncharacterized protein DUF1638